MRLSIQIVLFMIFMQAGAVAINASGVADDLGIDPETGNPDKLQTAQETAADYETGQGGGSTLFGLYNSLSGVLNVIVDAVFPAASMLKNAGVPAYFVNFLFSGASLYVGVDLMGFLRSGGLTQ